MKPFKYFYWLFFVLFLPIVALAQNPLCQSTYQGKKLTSDQLQTLISNYQNLYTTSQPLAIPNFCGANLSNVTLSMTNLKSFNFSTANLSNSIFAQSDLSGSNLSQANLTQSTLINCNLTSANLSGANLSQAKLSNSNLEQANLENANLSQADLSHANLRQANLQGANLQGANLQGANLDWAVLTQANLTQTNLENANLEHSNLTQANLTHANLTNTNLNNSNLTEASLTAVNMTDTHFANANLYHAVFEPLPSTMPNIMDFLSVNHFTSIRLNDFHASLAALVALRDAYERMDIDNMARNTTAVIKYQKMRYDWNLGGLGYIKSIGSYLLFYLTSNFGAAPNRPLKIWFLLIILFAFPYYFSLRSIHPTIKIHEALYISVLVALTIGWKKYTIKAWISKFHPPAYSLPQQTAIQRLRMLHILLSLYLIGFWFLLYFSTPFEWAY